LRQQGVDLLYDGIALDFEADRSIPQQKAKQPPQGKKDENGLSEVV
jgi:hypothetical protein